jgi:hypothetical protein
MDDNTVDYITWRYISPSNVDERHNLYLQLRMYSINVPVSRSVRLTQRSVTTDDQQ